jgi:hypothetical protein
MASSKVAMPHQRVARHAPLRSVMIVDLPPLIDPR